ncbi:MAG: hypothetical protein M5U32_20010 [Myxococcota bacterium]|nr:hypothetical protein [Myxococcota bacterium]
MSDVPPPSCSDGLARPFDPWSACHVANTAALFALYQVVAGIVFHRVVAGERTMLGTLDSSLQSFAWLTKVWRATRAGELALWDFAVHAGTSFAGELQTAPFYPPTLLVAPFVTLGEPWHVDLFIVGHYGLGAFFMHCLLRSLGLSFGPRFIGSVIFAFAGAVAMRGQGQPNLHAGLMYMPFVALCVRHALAARAGLPCAKWTVLGGIGLGLMLLAGHAHGFIHMAVAAALLSFITAWRAPAVTFRRAAIVLAGVAAASAALALVQIVPSAEYLERAYKWHGETFTTAPHIVPYSEYRKHVLASGDLSTLWNPGRFAAVRDGSSLFATLTGLAMLGFAWPRRREPIALFAITAIAFALLMATTPDTRLGLALYHVPILNLVRLPTRAMHLYAFAMPILIALGADEALASDAAVESPACARDRGDRDGGRLRELAVRRSPADPTRPPHGARVEVLSHVARLRDRGTFSERGPRVPDDGGSARRSGAECGRCLRPDERHGLPIEPVGRLLRLRLARLRSPLRELRFAGSALPADRPQLPGVPDHRSRRPPHPLRSRESAGHLLECSAGWGPRPLDLRSVEWRTNSVRVELAVGVDGSLVFSQPDYPGWRVAVDGRARELGVYDVFPSVALEPADRVVEFVYAPRWLAPLCGLSLAVIVLGAALVVLDWRGRAAAPRP